MWSRQLQETWTWYSHTGGVFCFFNLDKMILAFTSQSSRLHIKEMSECAQERSHPLGFTPLTVNLHRAAVGPSQTVDDIFMSVVCTFCNGFMTVAYCDSRTAQWPWGNICLAGCGRGQGRVGIHMGLDLVMKEGREWMGNKQVALSHTVNGDRKWIKNTYVNAMMDGVSTLDWHGVHEHISAPFRRDSWWMFSLPHPNCERQNSAKWCHYYCLCKPAVWPYGLCGI